MSAENVAAIRRVYDEMAKGNFWATVEVLDPEIAWSWTPGTSVLTGTQTYHGIDGVEAATRDWFKAWDRFWQEAEDFIEVGDSVVVPTRTHGRPKGTQGEVHGSAADVWTFRRGKAVRFQSFASLDEAMEALGKG